MSRNRRTKITFPIFNDYQVTVIESNNLVRTGLRLNSDLSGAHAGFISSIKDPRLGWIVLGPNADEGTVAHEASHAIRAMLAYVGARNEDEVFAYHIGFLVERIHKFLKQQHERSQ
jgi:hypothetical protein